MSLFISFVGLLLAFAVNSAPAMAISINPDAASPGIKDGNVLHWILFVVIIAVIVVVNLAILRAARPRTRAEKPKPRRKLSQSKLAIGLGVFAIALFVVSTVFSDKSREIPVGTETVAGQTEGEPLEIRATGMQWLWRFDYPNGAFGYRKLVVPTGTAVTLRLVSTDVVHGWNVPELTGKAQAIPGRTNYVHFRVDEPGVFKSRSSVLSGQGYDTMEIEVEAVDPAEYEATIETLKQDIQDAQDKVEAEFQAAKLEAKAGEAAGKKMETEINQDDIESAEAE